MKMAMMAYRTLMPCTACLKILLCVLAVGIAQSPEHHNEGSSITCRGGSFEASLDAVEELQLDEVATSRCLYRGSFCASDLC
jgi:hypothetical protein